MNGRVRVVLVDDSARVREVLRFLLEQPDRFAVLGEAADGWDGWHWLQTPTS